MATDVVTILKAEIAGLEKQLGTRRRALAILVGTAPNEKTPPTMRRASVTAAPRPPRPPAKGLAARVHDYLAAHKGQKFTPTQVADALQKTDKTVSRANVQRRLSDLIKAKKVKRDDGRYGLLSA